MLKHMKSIFKACKCWEFWILFITFILLIYVAFSLLKSTGWSCWFDSDSISNYGDFLGGIATVISIYYLYRTLHEQGRQFQIQNFEGRFLEMVRFNRNAVEQMNCIDTSRKEMPKVEGKEVFEFFHSQLNEAIEIIKVFVAKDQNRLFDESEGEKNVWSDNLRKEQKINNIAFLITFFGVKNAGYNLLKTRYLLQYNTEGVEKLLREFRLKLSASACTNTKSANPIDISKQIKNEEKLFAGFQYSVGNYFRTLFQCVKYVNKQAFLNYEEKYEYVKMLRCQMSNVEEKILFYDTICDLGKAWEYEGKKNKDVNSQLITKYNLIKNIPLKNQEDIACQFYPEISFEGLEEEPSQRKDLEKQYT